ncbi:ATP-dependent helicase HrpB [Pseudoxanthomonas sp. CF125]|uniref:ATP-dependent helicase HrpB n=1 Tax=Pseudoxanthomonas sp. CF125 TaxID=1855303 RepID=UPI000891179F|nr:ATP-dependent helicase HrpB [Pseudoxanthomonas sp. CF125]SDR13217.1 ATP-dependent helicase HrpB [Pseudoxanthomonas sp. CF125]
MVLPSFPIQALLPQIRTSLAAHPRLVLEAPPGAGKTTQVPLALLDEAWLAGRKIVMLEPRRVAARAAAGFMAGQLGEAVGETVGYRIRFENKVSARTRVEVVTEGIFTRMLQDDPMLEGIGALLFDEFHERHLAGDLGLALALDVQEQLREDLRIVVMSATLDSEKLARFLDAPRLSSEGRSYPVTVAHFPGRRDESLESQARRAVEESLEKHPGDVLVFLPGQREIARVEAALSPSPPGTGVGVRVRRSSDGSDMADFAAPQPLEAASIPGAACHPLPVGEGKEIVVLPLHGELSIEQQSQALQPDPQGRRRVVLATNVAESSVTLPGVRVVIDSGLAREPRYDPNSGFARLQIVNISQASADQRAGRAGRVAEGWAYRLWPQSQRLEPQRRPEIAQVELASLALELAAWGSDALRFVDTSPAGALSAARDLLRRLGALAESDSITALGKRMLTLGTHPRLAAMLLSAQGEEDRALACDLAALVEARDPLRNGGDALAARWRALSSFRQGRVAGDAHRSGLAAIDAAAKQWRRRLRVDSTPPRDIEAHRLGDLLAHAFPDRIAHQHPLDPRRYQLANGRMARVFDDSAIYGEPWIVASELRYETKDALILRAAPVDEARLRHDFPQRFVSEDAVRWDAARRVLQAQRETRFDQIVLETRPAGRVDPQHAAAALTEAVRELGLDSLPWSEPLRQWRERVRSLRQWMPELGLPDLSDEALIASLADWLRPAFVGKTRLDALGEEELADALKSGLDWSQRQRVDQLAPVRIAVPSGMERKIEYTHGHSPVLAVKLQELFGLADTPRVADGRIPVTLHLLSPGGKPLQVTQDLRGFWERTYPEVKKEMKGRYPRHPWPDDPWTAMATHRAKPRGT